MGRYKNVRLTDNIVNLTNEPIALYEDTTGEIKSFEPIKTEPKNENLPEIFNDDNESITYYVVEDETLGLLKKFGCRLENIAIIDCSSRGRDDITVVRLVWAENPKVRVRLYEGAGERLPFRAQVS